ncbi:unnamed protein product [Dibothriocephalus latus]|uniref:Uncharacterized protein n=1 Tax=Dibothriocephalus latus TaxID=60516 RepID=A0A3P7NL87_DIBLA|nr:unnamed protein product [Dibothriocephalus latus]
MNVPGSLGGNTPMDLKNGLTSLCGMPNSGWDADSSQRQQDLPQFMMLKRLLQSLNPGAPESRDAALSGAARSLNYNTAFSAPVQFADMCNGLQQSQALALAQLLSAATSVTSEWKSLVSLTLPSLPTRDIDYPIYN